MKNILCFGDSLTWGYIPDGGTIPDGGAIPDGGRHEYDVRWPSVLQTHLGNNKVRVIADGLNGRTSVYDDFSFPANLNGAQILPTVLATHQPLDCVIIMLGTNDLKPAICGCPMAAARGMQRLARIVLDFPSVEGAKVPKIMLVAPPLCVETKHDVLGEIFAGAPEKSQKLAANYQAVARDLGVEFFNAAKFATASQIDGVHLDAKNTIVIGQNMAVAVKDLLQI